MHGVGRIYILGVARFSRIDQDVFTMNNRLVRMLQSVEAKNVLFCGSHVSFNCQWVGESSDLEQGRCPVCGCDNLINGESRQAGGEEYCGALC